MRNRKVHIVFRYDDAKAAFLDSKSQAEAYRDKAIAAEPEEEKANHNPRAGWHIRTLDCIDFG